MSSLILLSLLYFKSCFLYPQNTPASAHCASHPPLPPSSLKNPLNVLYFSPPTAYCQTATKKVLFINEDILIIYPKPADNFPSYTEGDSKYEHNISNLTLSCYLIAYFSQSHSRHTGPHAVLKHNRQREHQSLFTLCSRLLEFSFLRCPHANSLNSFRFLLNIFFSITPFLQAQPIPASFFSIAFVTTWHTIHLLIYSFVSISSPQNECKLNLSFNSVYNLADM